MKPSTLPANIFIGPKTSRAIPVGHHLRRDFLIQATLDHHVRTIEYHPSVMIDGAATAVDAIILNGDDGHFAVDIVDARPACDPQAVELLHLAFAECCSGIMTLDETEIRREPRFSKAREIWRYRNVVVSADDREEMIATLNSEGPIPLRALQGLVNTTRSPTALVFAMACTGELSVDLRLPLNDRAIVRLGHVHAGDFGRLSFGT